MKVNRVSTLWKIAVAVGCLCALLLWLAFHSVRELPLVIPALTRSVKVMTLTEDRSPRYYHARVVGGARSVLSFPEGGQLMLDPVPAGTLVKAGALLAVLDQRELLDQVRSLQSQILQTQDGIRQVQRRQDRSENLRSQRILAPLKLQTIKSDLVRAKAELKELETALEALNARLQSLEIRAPSDGLVSRCFASASTNVEAGQAILEFQDLSAPQVAFVAHQSDMVRFADPQGWTYQAVFDGEPPLELEFKAVGAPRGQRSNLFPVTMELLNPSRPPLPGRTCVVKVTSQAAGSRIFQIPLAALARGRKGDQSAVWRYSDGQVQRVAVTVRAIWGSMAVVAGDCQWGDRIVTGGLYYLRDGQKVTLVG